MKKIIYILAFALFSAATITACTEEEVTPAKSIATSGGGNSSSDGNN